MDQMTLAPQEPIAFPLEPGEPRERLARAAGRLPAGEQVQWSEMPAGRAYPSHMSVDAAAFRGVGTGGRDVFAKVYHADAASFFDLGNSAAAARLAGRHGLGPPVIGHDAGAGVVTFEGLGPPWRVATCADLRKRDTCAAIVERRRAWSGMDFAEGIADDAFLRARTHAALAMEVMSHRVLADLGFFALRDCVERIGQAFAAAGTDIAPILGDTAVSNVMLDDAGGVKLVDFDFAGRGDPVRDLAGLCLEACSYDDDGVEEIVEMHAGVVRPDMLARVRLLMLVEDFIWASWAVRLHGSSPRKDACEFFAYAGTRLLRAGHAMASLDVSRLTRAI